MKIAIKITDKPDDYDTHRLLRQACSELSYSMDKLKSITITDDSAVIIATPHVETVERAEPIF